MEDKECIVIDCANKESQGRFVGEVCAPCYDWIMHRKISSIHSQAYRNEQDNKPILPEGKILIGDEEDGVPN